ncbi:VC0807 family protein [Deinococcus aquaedulcis]|uniref:VC0807 family protein n=1 Tax=Deinococcus aquaedulcis TaxID=2840455 RepID=UPI001C838C7B|nr:VC0807 family protein [Deinococcus aquaedulcis]
MSQAAPTPTPVPPAKARVPKTVWDLVFTLLIPIAILSPNILGSGISVAEQVFGGGTAGNVRAYLLAALVPVAYVLWDLLVNRNVSPVALIGGAGAIFSGALAFWYVDGFWYAIKDSARSYLTGLLFLISAATSVPLFRVFLDASSIGESPEHRAATQTAMRDPVVHRGLVGATVVFAVVDLIGGVVNSLVNYARVTAKFGTDSFNAQVAEVNAVMRIPGLAITLVGVFVAIWLVQRAVRARYGQDASLFEPGKLLSAMRQRGEAPEAAAGS